MTRQIFMLAIGGTFFAAVGVWMFFRKQQVQMIDVFEYAVAAILFFVIVLW